MKILHVIQSLDPAWGGIARVVPMLAAELVRAGDVCRIATLAGRRYGAPPPVAAGVDVVSFSASDGGLGRSRDFDARIASLVQDADIVHLHGLWTGQNWSAGRAARRAPRPYVMTPHSHMMPWAWRRSAWKKRPIGWLFEHRNLRRAARLHALADGEAVEMRALGFNDRIVTIPNGLHVDEFKDPPDPRPLYDRFPTLRGKRILLFLGRVHPQKGIVQVMKACFDAGAAAGADWHLVVAGPDELGMVPMLQAAMVRKGVADRATFTGLLSRDEVRCALGVAGILIQPSRSEGLSMSILEALAAGVPVIISPACNMPEVEAAGAGRVVEPRREFIAPVLWQWMSMSPAELSAMGARGRQLARERFDWSVVIPQYQRMYRDAGGTGME